MKRRAEARCSDSFQKMSARELKKFHGQQTSLVDSEEVPRLRGRA